MTKGPQLFASRCRRTPRRTRSGTGAWFACNVAIATIAGAADSPAIAVSAQEWQALLEQNQQLRALLASQQDQIDELRRRVEAVSAVASVEDRTSAPITEVHTAPTAPSPSTTFDRKVIVGGEAGVAFFAGGAATAFPQEEFRVDEARLFVEAEVARNVYLFTELDLTRREAADEYFRLGECYIEFAEIPAPWGGENAFTVRAGRLDVPFGEEYRHRDVMQNPLISHSLSDLWGIDEGVEVFGRAGAWHYTIAVQNGSHRALHDFDSDKAVVARLGVRPRRQFHGSVSVMRTGNLARTADQFSEIWIANGFFRAIGHPATTTTFRANLAQIDARYDWTGGHVLGALGRAWYDDDDTATDNSRALDFHHVEARQSLGGRVYGALRYSRIETDRGYPLVGHGTFADFLFGSNFTAHIWRIGLGLGYDPAENLRLKLEYTWERGRLTDGRTRGETDQLAAEAGVKF